MDNKTAQSVRLDNEIQRLNEMYTRSFRGGGFVSGDTVSTVDQVSPRRQVLEFDGMLYFYRDVQEATWAVLLGQDRLDALEALLERRGEPLRTFGAGQKARNIMFQVFGGTGTLYKDIYPRG